VCQSSVTVVPICEWAIAADDIERLARERRMLCKYRRLISELRRRMVGERCGERAVLALAKLRG
jgi:hypothetical protein